MDKVFIVKGFHADNVAESKPFIFGVYSTFSRAKEVADFQSSEHYYYYVDPYVVE